MADNIPATNIAEVIRRTTMFKRLVAWYVMTAHASLALAFFLTAWNPHAVAGFFYHSWMIALVHLITIGWIAMSLLGCSYVIIPTAFGVPLPAGRGDYVAFASLLIGLIGMVAHFWIAEYGGMAWSAATAAGGLGFLAVRIARQVRRARIPGGVALHVHFATVNVLAAIAVGVLLGFDKVYHFLPGYVLSNVFAHAHLAAVGWACMMVVAIGYQAVCLLSGREAASASRTSYATAWLLESGVWGLFAALTFRISVTIVPAMLIVTGFATFAVFAVANTDGLQVVNGHNRAALWQFIAAAVWLLLACFCGVLLAALPTSEATLRIALLYGTFGLVGFLGQVMVLLQQWLLAMVASGDRTGDNRKRLRTVAAVLSLAGVPATAAALFQNTPPILAFGAGCMFVAAVIDGACARKTLIREG